MELRQHVFQLLRNRQADMGGIFQKAHALIGNIEEDYRCPQRVPRTDHLRIQDMPRAHHHEDQHLAEDPPEPHLAG